MYCIRCEVAPIENPDTMLCASCSAADRKLARKAVSVIARETKKKEYKIPKMSGKMAKAIPEYSAKKQKWIKGKMCVVFPHLKAEDVHHSAGRQGYADDWARENHITLLMDERFWIPVSRKGHVEVELHPKWSKQMGFSISRL